MDLAALGMILMLAATVIGVDTLWHPTEVILQASAAGKIDRLVIDEPMVVGIVTSEVDRITATPTLVGKPRVQLGKQGGVGMAIATVAKLEEAVYALQRGLGREPDRMRITLFSEEGTIKALVTGSGGQRVRAFEQEVDQKKGETVVALLHRAALVGMARIDPYLTALSLMQRHASDADFTDAEGLIAVAKGQIPPMPRSIERSLFENLQGILALFRDKVDDAHTWFRLALASNPDNAAAVLNLAFTDLQRGRHRAAADRLGMLLQQKPDLDTTLMCTAYVTRGAARLGLGDINGADEMLAKAIAIKPASAIAWSVWGEVKRRKGEPERAERMQQQALNVSDRFENYAEIAVLYFQLVWQDNQPIMRNQFVNPEPASTR